MMSTVAHITAGVIGILYAETVSPGTVRQIKYCECCGFLFVRSSNDRYCRHCHANPEPLGRAVTVEILEELETEVPLPQ
jgi:hypothetical protein